MKEEDPINLLKYNRFDIGAKTLYLKLMNKDTEWGTEIYREHLKTWNGYSELLNNRKNSFSKFIEDFHNIYNSINNNGYNKDFPILVNNDNLVINGAHRLSSSIVLGKKVFVKKSENPGVDGQWECYYDFFKNRSNYFSENDKKFPNLDTEYLDAMACEYSRIKKNTYIIMTYPSISHGRSFVRNLISKKLDIVYLKEISLTKNGLTNLIKNLYYGMEWIGHWENLFQGIHEKLIPCYGRSCDGKMDVYLVEADSIEDIKNVKQKIRDHFGISNHSCHSTDNNEETLSLSNIVFNKNSIHYLNNAVQKKFEKFNNLLCEYKTRINSFNNEDICLVGSFVLGAYGIRDVNDLDFIHSEDFDLEYQCSFSSHNGEINNYRNSIDDIIYNPRNFFWYEGVKFASLKVILDMKEKRGEFKDILDIKMSRGLLLL